MVGTGDVMCHPSLKIPLQGGNWHEDVVGVRSCRSGDLCYKFVPGCIWFVWGGGRSD